MIALLAALALAGEVELDEPVATDKPVTVGSTVYHAPDPIYLIPTPTFDRFLVDTKKLAECTDGLERIEGKVVEARQDLATAQQQTFAAMQQASSALAACSAQAELDAANDAEQLQTILALERDVSRARAQRNIALTAASAVGAVLLVEAVLAR